MPHRTVCLYSGTRLSSSIYGSRRHLPRLHGHPWCDRVLPGARSHAQSAVRRSAHLSGRGRDGRGQLAQRRLERLHALRQRHDRHLVKLQRLVCEPEHGELRRDVGTDHATRHHDAERHEEVFTLTTKSLAGRRHPLLPRALEVGRIERG
ncbi:hypothetical protein Ctob_003025 [Chrysochromulina tobinii]|uniref:Uncharacterized protein n=1 Tax=Chrysochromulina tobinii TaxID=1460289 RepID=A0A0M0JEJ2_9EUKA|nr:hypothetical protein Ctob_003025 [Chrysochromulina tobinii]|eukprot:KOO24870.1 hypothetical protein Ctob_003025 [Chrysochromulina sp. CCMP291]